LIVVWDHLIVENAIIRYKSTKNEYSLRSAIASADDHYGTLGDSFLARTDPNARYTNVVAEYDCLEDFEDGSEYTKASDRTLQRSTTATTKRRISVEK
jgi:hypothetical protein